MGRAKFKSADFPKLLNDISDRRQQEFDKRRKRTYWTIRQSDDRIAKTDDAIRRTRELLQQAWAVAKSTQTQARPIPGLWRTADQRQRKPKAQKRRLETRLQRKIQATWGKEVQPETHVPSVSQPAS